jgi:hypothetical protein
VTAVFRLWTQSENFIYNEFIVIKGDRMGGVIGPAEKARIKKYRENKKKSR